MKFSLTLATFAAAIFLLFNCIAAMSLPPPMQKPCCSPVQWESGIGYVMSGNSPYSSGYGKMAYDYTGQMLALNQTFFAIDGKRTQQRMLMNGNTHKMYTLDVVTGRCTTSSMSSDIQRHCVPPNFYYTTTISLGEPSSHFNVLVFDANVHGGYSMSFVVTQNLCAPFSLMQQLSHHGKDTLSLQSFFNFTTGIQDRSVFAIPPGCKAESAEHDDLVAALIMRQAGSISASSASQQPCTMFSPCWLAQGMQV